MDTTHTSTKAKAHAANVESLYPPAVVVVLHGTVQVLNAGFWEYKYAPSQTLYIDIYQVAPRLRPPSR